MVDDDQLRLAAAVVIGAQLGVPPLFGWLAFRGRKQVQSRERARTASEAAAPRQAVAPVRCGSCGAAVALEPAAFPCPFCGAVVEPPADLAAEIALAAQTDRELARAERLWRLSRWSCSRPVTWLSRIGGIVWTLLVLAAAAGLSESWPGLLLGMTCILAIVALFPAFGWASALDDARRALPALPERSAMRAPAEAGSCQECGAPIRFAADRFAASCGYCRATNYRAALLHAARDQAAADEGRARKSLLDAVASLDERKRDLLMWFGFMLIAEGFYAAFFGFMWVSDALGL